jgi:hypothetical protein
MKTQIIRLETYDDAVSVKDKMGWGQTPRILLVWPLRDKVLNRRLDLLYLKRHSVTLGAQLALVTADSDIKHHAGKLGIPIFSSIRKAEESHWRKSRRERRKKGTFIKALESPFGIKRLGRTKTELKEQQSRSHHQTRPWLTHPITRISLFSLGVLGILAIGALLVPRAEILLTPITITKNIQIPVTASLNTSRVALSGRVPAREVKVIVEGRGSHAASGSLTIPDLTATGKVRFTNLTDQEINIPIGTVVTTNEVDPVQFITTAEGLAAPNEQSPAIPIEALLPGTDSNVKADTIQAIEGPLGLNLTVINPLRTSGGSFRPAPAPTEADYQLLFEQLLQTLHATAAEELSSQIGSNALLLYSNPQDYAVISETYIPTQIQAADKVHLTLRVEFQALIASENDLKELGYEVLAANIPAHFSGDRTSLKVANISTPTTHSDGRATWDMEASWQMNATFDKNEAISLALWQAPAAAIKHIQAQLPVAEPEINLIPSWWPRLPILPFRVNIIIQP